MLLGVVRIIVADDDQDIGSLVNHRLTSLGMEVELYVDGQSALEAIESNPPDLAIIDVMMPRMNGLDVTRAVRANPAIRDLPIVLFTALVRPDDQDAGLAAGADHYVVKPFSVLALGAFVEKLLGLRKCVRCGKSRGVDDIEYSPEQLLQRTQLGWTVTVDGDVCGECLVESVNRLNRTW